MRKMPFLFLLVSFLLVGCQSKTAQLVGTWKARPVEQKSSKNLGDVAAAGFLGFAAQHMTIEFNKDGEFKISQLIGSGTGTYAWEGNDLVLKLNTLAPEREIHLVMNDDGTLSLKRKFESDPTVVFEKQKS